MSVGAPSKSDKGESKALYKKNIYLKVYAEAVVHARHWVALVDLEGAIFSSKSGFALADEIVHCVDALATVLARVADAVVDVRFAVVADKT